MHIYKWTHKETGKCYIGQSIQDPNQRRLEHINNSRYTKKTYHFHNALRKYGIDEFTWEVIDTAASLEELNLLEEKYVVQYDSINNGYNIRQPGNNKKHNKESIERMREAQKLAHIRRKLEGRDGGPMKGKTHPNKGKSCANKGKKKGMTWEEIYGIEGAAQRRQHRAMLALSRKSGG
jgi:group I intron endonuclease